MFTVMPLLPGEQDYSQLWWLAWTVGTASVLTKRLGSTGSERLRFQLQIDISRSGKGEGEGKGVLVTAKGCCQRAY